MAVHEDLTGTAVVVTGGGRGLGRVMVGALAAAGASVLVVDVDSEPIGEVCRETPGDVHGQLADISGEDGVAVAVERAEALFGRVDVLVNNAGINLHTIGGDLARSTTPPFYDLAPDAVRRFLEVHVMAPFLLSRAVVAKMTERGFGRIITVTTSLPTMLRARGAPYGPAKAASEAFAACMAADLSGSGVTVNVLIPGGAVATRFVGDLAAEPGRFFVDAAVMGPPAVWLASRDSDGFTAMRVTAKDWDAGLPGRQAAVAAAAPIGWLRTGAAVT